MLRLVLVVIALVAVACSPVGAAPTQPQEEGPTSITITSAGDPTSPVPFFWAIKESHKPDGHQLLLTGGTMHAIPSDVRLLNQEGKMIVRVAAVMPTSGERGLCQDNILGMVRADLPLPAGDMPAFDKQWPTGYRVEVQVGGLWRPAELANAGCRYTE